MKKYIAIALAILVVVVGFAFFQFKGSQQGPEITETNLGLDREGSGFVVKEFDQVGITASASVQGLLKNSPGRVVAFEVWSDSQSIRYFQLFDQTQAVVPDRSASVSGGFQSFKIYKASTSWASSTALTNKPLGSYQQYASPSLVTSYVIPAATASSSPSVVRVDFTQLGGARTFTNGIMWGISTAFSTYASPSVATNPAARVKVKLIYE